MNTTHRLYTIITAVIVLLQLTFGFQSTAVAYADDAGGTAGRGCHTDTVCN